MMPGLGGVSKMVKKTKPDGCPAQEVHPELSSCSAT